MFYRSLFKENLLMKPNLLRSLALVLVFTLASTGFSFVVAGEAKKFDEILPANSLFFMGIDDYALFEKYAESMPISKILKEEEKML